MKTDFKSDIISFGSFAGIIGNIPKTIIAEIFRFLGWTRYSFIHIAAGYFVDAKFLDSPVAVATGLITDFLTAALLGVLMYAMLRSTGFDFAKTKGFFFGAILYVVLFGTFMSLDLTRASLLTPLPNFLLFFPHTIFGIVTCWVLEKYGCYNERAGRRR